MVVRIGFPVLLRVLILDLPFGNDSYGLSDRASRLASGINPGPIVTVVQIGFPSCFGY